MTARYFFYNPWVLWTWIVPFIQGYIGYCALDENTNVILISWRRCTWVGTRLNARGIDKYGHVANFVETEVLIVPLNGVDEKSIVIIWGSVPLFWE